MASIIKRFTSGLDFWDKEENKRQREQYARESRPVTDNTPGFQITNNSLTRGVSRAIDQVNPADNGRTWKQRTPVGPNLSAVNQVNTGLKRLGTGIGLGGVRSGVGFAQGVSGLVDLASPGTGTNRVSKKLDKFAKFVDETSANEGVKSSYKGGQLVGDVLSFAAGGAVAKGAAKIPAVTKKVAPVKKAVKPASTALNKGTTKLASKGPAGRVAATTVKGLTNPANNVANIGMTGKLTGENASKGRDTSAKTVAQDLAIGTAFNAGLPLAGGLLREGARYSVPAAKKTASGAKKVKYVTDKTDPGVRELDRQYAELNTRWQTASGQSRKQIEQAIAANRQSRSDLTRLGPGMGIRKVQPTNPELPQSGAPHGPSLPRVSGKAIDGNVAAFKRKPQKLVAQKNKQTSLESQKRPELPVKNVASPQTLTSGRVARQQLSGPENLILKMQEATPSADSTTKGMIKQPAVKGSRTATKTAPKSDYVSEELAASIKKNAPTYTVQTQQGRLGSTGARLSKNEDAFTRQLEQKLDTELGKISSQDVTDTQGLAAILDARGDDLSLQKATELYTKLSEHLTAAGQTVQAAALIAKRSPQGLRFYAQKQLEKAGIKMTPEKTKELTGLIDSVKKAKPGTKDELIARDNIQYWIAKNVPSTKADQIVNFWRSGLLTAPTTTGGALAGNTFATLQRKLWINPIATMTDMVLSLGTGKRGRAAAVPGAFGQGLMRGGKNVGSKQYWKTGYDPMNPNATADSMGAGGRRVNYGDGRMGQAMGHYVNGVYKLMGAADQPFRYAAFDEVLSSLARTEAINKGLQGADRSIFIKQFMDNPPESALQRATDEAMDATFQNRTALADAITSVKQGLKQKGHHKAAALVDFFIPFSGVPSSVASRVIRHTPLGTANTLVKQILAVKKGEAFDQRLMSQAIAEGSAGVPIIGAGFALSQAGLITGGYPSDPKERQRWTDQGKQENAIKVGDRWYSLNYIQPFGTLLSVGAGIAQAEGEDGENPALSDYITQATQSGVKSFAGQSYLEGVTAPLEAINNPEQEAGRYIAGAASGIVPNFIRSAARASDTVQRDASGVVDGVKGAIPGLRQTLPAKIGSDGKPLPNKDNFLNMYVNPLKPSKAREDNPVVQETSRLLDAGFGVSAAPVKTIDFGDKTVRLDKQQKEEYNSALGQLRTEQWRKVMSSPGYKSLTDVEKQGVLQKVSKDVNAVLKYAYAERYGAASLPELTRDQQLLIDSPESYTSSTEKGSTVTTKAPKRAKPKKTAKKSGKRKGGRKGRKNIPQELLNKALDIPEIARTKTKSIQAKAPSAPSFKKPRKSIPKIAKAKPSTPKVTRLRA